MLSLLYDFVPVLLFFMAFKFYGIYAATLVGIVVTALQVLISAVWLRRFDKKQVITLGVFILFGGMTLYFHNPIFVKWKPTIIFWIFSLALLFSQFFGKKTLVQRMLESMVNAKATVPSGVWKKLNFAWAVFFLSLGAVNIYVGYTFSTDAWVNFKFYGITVLLLAFSFGQAIFLARYLVETK